LNLLTAPFHKPESIVNCRTIGSCSPCALSNSFAGAHSPLSVLPVLVRKTVGQRKAAEVLFLVGHLQWIVRVSEGLRGVSGCKVGKVGCCMGPTEICELREKPTSTRAKLRQRSDEVVGDNLIVVWNMLERTVLPRVYLGRWWYRWECGSVMCFGLEFVVLRSSLAKSQPAN